MQWSGELRTRVSSPARRMGWRIAVDWSPGPAPALAPCVEDVRNLVESERLTQSRDRLWVIFCQEKESLVKRQYQISGRGAAEKFRKWALTNPTPIQLTFPIAEVAELAQTSLGDLLRGVGKGFIETVMEAEVEQIAGKRSAPNPDRSGYRWGSEEGFC